MTGHKKTSVAWQYFTDIGNFQALCKICNDIFSYKTSVSNLNKHIVRKHSSVYVAMRNSVIKKNSSSEMPALADHGYRAKEKAESHKDDSSVEMQESNDEYETIEIRQDDIQGNETADPMFVEFLEHTGSSPTHKIENSPSPPPTGSKRRRTRYSYSRAKEHKMDPRHLLEIKRLELETLREKNLNEKERIKAQLDRDSLKVQERLVAFLEDIKPALIQFLKK